MRRICDRRHGLGSDGILVPRDGGPLDAVAVAILNPDGSEAQMSGNGLRIWARHLVDAGFAASESAVPVRTAGAAVTVRVHADGTATIALPPPRFASSEVPVAGPDREVLLEPLDLDGERLAISAVSVGNPHCVVRRDAPTAADARRLGPRLEHHPLFPERANVQLVEVVDRQTLRIEIWERGAGYTLASGSSSCAAAAVARRLDWCDGEVRVRMPGGEVTVQAGSDRLVLRGPITRVAHGRLDRELLAR